MNKSRLEDMPQYHIKRDKFYEIVKETIGYEVLAEAFCYGQFNCTDVFAWFREGDEFYIVHLGSGMMINWYKHFGRTNTCSQEGRTIEDYYEFFRLFREELEYWAGYHNYKDMKDLLEEKSNESII